MRRAFISVMFRGLPLPVMLGLLLCATVRPTGAAPVTFLRANGTSIRNNNGSGDVVQLRGVNLGGWLLFENWMSPMDSSGLADNQAVVQTLNSRFGVGTQESLVKAYQESWITTTDLDNIKALGMNCVRIPFWWGNVQRLDGSWRADAFEKLDWVVTNAWQRGIYSIIDFHGVPGGQSASDSTAQANLNQYWTSTTFQNQTTMIWSNIASHFSSNPGVAGYDLINEPYGAPNRTAIWTAYDGLYHTIRAVDPNHMIFMEGTWAGQGLNWEWNVLPPPTYYSWTNVVYSMHAYAGSTTAADEKAETDKQVSDFNNHLSWNVPCFIGEFNSHGTQTAWQYSALQYNQNNMSWDNWAYKAIAGGVGNSWGIYDPAGSFPPVPNIQSDSSASIQSKWTQWSGNAFGVTMFLRRYLGAPLAVDDLYTAGAGTLTISGNGVLANDSDINTGTSGISMSVALVTGTANGQLTLNTNGSFTYTPNAGFSGTDTFRYRVFDGYVTSANIATVSIVVNSGPVLVPSQVRIETKANGSGDVVAAQDVAAGTSLTSYAIIRDASGTYISNAVAAWVLVSKTGGVLDSDLVTAPDNRSAAFNAHKTGSVYLKATAGAFNTFSGLLTAAPGPATQLSWTSQPGAATNGFPFAQQPVLRTVDAYGNPSSVGLPASLNVNVSLTAGTGPLVGTTTRDVGSAAGNGQVAFTDLQINSTGTNKQLTAATSGSLPSTLTSAFSVYAAIVSPTNGIVGVSNIGGGVIQITFIGTLGSTYYVQTASNLPPVAWSPVNGSTNLVTNGSGLWTFTVTNSGPQQFYRAVLAN